MIRKVSIISALLGASLLAVSSAAGAEELKIGMIGALTGGPAEYGLAAKEALNVIANQVNAKGGLDVSGRKYQLSVVAYDDQQKPAEAIAAYNRLVNVDGVKYIFLQSSSSTLALKDNAESDQTVLMSAAFSSKIIDADTKYTYRIYQNGANFVPSLIGWMKDNMKERSVATLNPNDETGWGQSEITKKAYVDDGFKVLSSELFERDQKDFAPVLTKLIGMNPEILDFGTTPPATAGLIVRQARELGYKGRFAQTGGPGWHAIVSAAGIPDTNGLVSVVYADPNNAAYQALAAAYKKDIGQAPNEIVVNYYDAAQVLLKAIQIAGDPTDTAKVVEAISKALPMKSLQGDDLKLAHQQIMSVDYVGVLKDGTPQVVGKLQ